MSERMGFWEWLYLIAKVILMDISTFCKSSFLEYFIGVFLGLTAIVYSNVCWWLWITVPMFALIALHGVYRMTKNQIED